MNICGMAKSAAEFSAYYSGTSILPNLFKKQAEVPSPFM
jgi:hypothetical protein